MIRYRSHLVPTSSSASRRALGRVILGPARPLCSAEVRREGVHASILPTGDTASRVHRPPSALGYHGAMRRSIRPFLLVVAAATALDAVDLRPVVREKTAWVENL